MNRLKLCAAGFAVIGAAGLSACATDVTSRVDDRVTAKLAQFEPTGDVKRCIPLRSIRSINAADEKTLLVEAGLNDYYVNRLPSRCGGITESFNRIQYTTSLSQLCSGEIIQVVDNTTGITSGSCGFGQFERLEQKVDEDASS